MLISLAGWLSSSWLPLLALLCGAAIWRLGSRPANRRKLLLALLRGASLVPATRALVHKAQAVRLLQILSLVLTSGGTVEQAMKLMHWAYSEHPDHKRALEGLRAEVINGGDFGIALDRSGLFPAIVGALLRVGYETGRLEKMSQRAVEICQEDVQLGLDTLSSLIEPILLGFAGLAAGFVVLTAAMPMLKLIQTL
jgi:type IV pilus assembly protein PilC